MRGSGRFKHGTLYPSYYSVAISHNDENILTFHPKNTNTVLMYSAYFQMRHEAVPNTVEEIISWHVQLYSSTLGGE